MTSPPNADLLAGMATYATGGAPCRGKIKTTPEDFKVEESLAGLEIAGSPGPGLYPIYRVEKKSIDTFHLAALLSVPLKSKVSFAGMKDKKAVAVQYATPTSTRGARPQRVGGERFSAELVGYVGRPLGRGMVLGNLFRIVVRECCPEIAGIAEEAFRLSRELRIPNFYGLQRFGSRGGLTHRVGRAIVRREFEEAARVMLCDGGQDETRGERSEAFASEKYDRIEGLLDPGQDTERVVARALAERPGMFLVALRAIPIALRRFYSEAYQSYIFNRTVSLSIQRGMDLAAPEVGDNWGEVSKDGLVISRIHGVGEPQREGAVPVVQLLGYAYRNYGSRFDGCIEEVLSEEGVRAKDFYVKEMQEVSLEGGFRRPHLVLRGGEVSVEGDTAVLGFTLARGGYATSLLREILKPTDPLAQGFA